MSLSDMSEVDENNMSWQKFLIEAVRCRPALYDKHHTDYKDSRCVKANLREDVTFMLLDAGYDSLPGAAIGKCLILFQRIIFSIQRWINTDEQPAFLVQRYKIKNDQSQWFGLF